LNARRGQGIPLYPQMPDRQAASDEIPPAWADQVFIRLAKSISDFAGLIEDRSHRVDEYQPDAVATADSAAVFQTSPDYDQYPIIVESVLVTGPAAAVATLALGKRNWSITMPASGILVIGPVKFSLGRNDQRTLTPAIPGAWSLEVMGYADIGYRFK
jgi:hypothetical protein